MPVVWIPSLLRSLTQGKETVSVPGTTVAEVIGELEKLFPGIKARLCQDDGLRPGLTVAVDTQVSRLGLLEEVGPNSEIHFLPAVGGG
jgi:molybdopterin synthase sulfur carrier subunit